MILEGEWEQVLEMPLNTYVSLASQMVPHPMANRMKPDVLGSQPHHSGPSKELVCREGTN